MVDDVQFHCSRLLHYVVDPNLERDALLHQARRVVPDAFDSDGHVLVSLSAGWRTPKRWRLAVSPIDEGGIAELPVSGAAEAAAAVEMTAAAGRVWSRLSHARRATLIAAGVESVGRHRDLLAGLLAWEIGKTRAGARSDVDRCLDGIAWYLEHSEAMIEARTPIGLVSNIASWNYPFSVLLLNVLVQALVGNAVIAKAPTQGGGVSLTVAFGLLRQAGLPVSLVSGSGADLTEPLVLHPKVSALAFVGGRTSGLAIAAHLRGTGRRYALEMEGVNAYVITEFSDWAALRKQIRAGFDFGKQRCTAYTRWVVDQRIAPQFVDTYREAVADVRVGHPLLQTPPAFGPLISSSKVQQLDQAIDDAVSGGATRLHIGSLRDADFMPGQSRRTYFAPVLLQGVPTSSDLYRREPFGPVDLLVTADTDEGLIAEANVSNGALVASVATDDPEHGRRIAARLRAFKVGVNRLRSRGDRDEAFGGVGASWEGAFVGGEHLVRAFTEGAAPVAGNWTPVQPAA